MTFAKRQTILGLIAAVLLLGGFVLILTGRPIPMAIGTSVVASGIVGLFEIVHRFLISEESQLLREAEKFGLSRIYARRDLDRYHELMPNASAVVDISGYSLRAFFDSFRDVLREKAQKNPSFRARLLVVDPSSTVSKSREVVEALAEGTFTASAQSLFRSFSDLSNVEVRLLSAPLTTMIFRIDGTMFIGPQLMSAASRATPTFELVSGKNDSLFSVYEKEFDKLWNAGSPKLKENSDA
ncbi:MAG: hypothetical protein WD049_00615 [Candidatus Paceibacterota bacterium]